MILDVETNTFPENARAAKLLDAEDLWAIPPLLLPLLLDYHRMLDQSHLTNLPRPI